LKGPDLSQRGFLHQPTNEDFLRRASDILEKRLRELEGGILGDEHGMNRIVRETLADFFWSQLKRRPMILPAVMEV
jgi:ribonuclease J